MKPKTQEQPVEKVTQEEYKYGFTTDIEADEAPPGLNEDIIRFISKKKNEPPFLLEWRLKCYRHWTKMKEPDWQSVHYPAINYQDIIYYSAPKQGPKSLDEVDPEILKMFDKLGVPLQEREVLAGVAVDAVMDSVSVGTT
ncbi:MAG TPA: Fe-S cluster assembly protein SufB, partial [bacterium]|nr:Fe-S cluster assembly protein SufB [bacterium]